MFSQRYNYGPLYCLFPYRGCIFKEEIVNSRQKYPQQRINKLSVFTFESKRLCICEYVLYVVKKEPLCFIHIESCNFDLTFNLAPMFFLCAVQYGTCSYSALLVHPVQRFAVISHRHRCCSTVIKGLLSFMVNV